MEVQRRYSIKGRFGVPNKLMHIVYLCQYFPPEMGAPSARVYELSREWVRAGHRVTVITAFSNHPTGIKSPEDCFKISRRETIDGIDVLRTYIFATPNKGSIKRMVSFASFMLSAAIVGAFRVNRPDVVIATSPQLLCGLSGFFLSRFWLSPFVFEVRDLWPESLIAVEIMRENILIKALRRLSKFLYKNSDSIVTVGDGYKQGICRAYEIPHSKLQVIPNGVDLNLYDHTMEGLTIRHEFGWTNKFVVMYVGTHGMAHGLNHVLDSAFILKEDPKIHFVFVGEGAEKDALMRQASDYKLKNVQFVNQQEKKRIPLFYAACDIGLVCLRNSALFKEVLPSKIFEILGMAKPVALMVDGESRLLIENAKAGVYITPGDSAHLANSVINLSKLDPTELKAMGLRGRNYAASRYNRTTLANHYLDHLDNILND